MKPGLPDGFRVRLRDDIRVVDSGRVVVGGAPMRALRFSAEAMKVFRGGIVEVHDGASRLVAARLLATDLGVPLLPDGAVSDSSELTVVIPAHDRPGELDRLLGGLRPELRCLVVDDASTDPSALASVVARHGAQLVALQENLGPAGARNAGLALVVTPLVAFVDSDVTADARVLRRLALHFADPDLGLVAPLVKGQSRPIDPPWFERYDAVASSLDLGGKPSGVRPGGAVAWVPSACIIARTAAVVEIGGFEETMRIGEDVDLVWRLVKRGWRARYDPEQVVEHQARSSLRSWLARKFDYGTGGAPLAARHGDLVAPAAFTITYAAAALAVLAQRRWSPAVVAAALAHATWVLHRKLPAGCDRGRLAVRLAVEGMGWAVRQESGLMLRHWWPVTAAALPFSRRLRRAVAVAVVVDTLVSHGRHRREIGLGSYAAGRRLDDLAYGAGLWAGAVRGRSTRVLLPRMVHRDPAWKGDTRREG